MNSDPTKQPDAELELDEILAAYMEAEEAGRPLDPQELLRDHPELAPQLAQFFVNQDQFDRLAAPLRAVAQAAAAATPPPGVTLPLQEGENGDAGYLPEGGLPSLGDYELLEKLAQGGMGVVYKARQKKLNRLVALKVVRTDFLSEADIQRFRNEAEIVAHLDHAHIVPIHEVGEQDGRVYFSMKLIEGGSLKQIVSGSEESRLSKQACRRAAQWVATVARAVHHAHQRGILHRDLKPSNILLDTQGRPHVTDFGLAKRIEVDSSLTESGVLVGTPSYMAPEQAASKRGAITTATDVYGLGAILDALLTGRSPFQGHSLLDTLEQVKEREPDPPSKMNRWVDRDLETICLKCLEKEPERRYGSAEALAEDLECFLAGKPIQARPVGPAARLWRWCKRHRTIAALTGIASFLLIAGVVGLLVSTLMIAAEQRQTKAALEQAQEQQRLAEEKESEVRLHLYVAHIGQARRLWEQGEREQALSLLAQHIPAPGQSDLRSFEWYYLQRLCQGQTKARRTLQANRRQVYCVVFAPDGKTLATAGQDRTVRLWDPADGRQLAKLEGHIDDVNWTAFSPDGKMLATASDDGTVRLWDVAARRMQRRLFQTRDRVVGVAFAPDGKRLAVSQDDGTLRVFELASGSEQASIRAHSQRIEFLAFSPDGSMLATAGHYDRVKLWEFPTLRQGMNLQYPTDRVAHAGGPRCLAFAHSSPLLAIGGSDTTVHLLDLVSGRIVAICRGHRARVESVAFAPDDRTLASSANDDTVRLWDVPSGTIRNVLASPMLPGFPGGDVWCVAFAPDGKTLAAADAGGRVRLWDPAVRLDCVALPGNRQGIRAIAFDRKGTLLATAANDRIIRLWDYKARRLDSATPPSSDVHEAPLSLGFSSDSRRLAAGLFHGRVSILDIVGKQKPWVFRVAKNPHHVKQVAFMDDNKTLLTNAGGKFQLWDAATGELREDQRGLGKVRGGPSPLTSDGKVLVIGQGSESISGVMLWDLRTRQSRSVRLEGTWSPGCLAISPDHTTVACSMKMDRRILGCVW